MAKRIKNYYVMIDRIGEPVIDTNSRTRTDAIGKLLNLHGEGSTWRGLKRKYRYQWVKVYIIFMPVPIPRFKSIFK